jgi:hypothetical protein
VALLVLLLAASLAGATRSSGASPEAKGRSGPSAGAARPARTTREVVPHTAAAHGKAALESGPSVQLETPGTGNVLSGLVEVDANVTGISGASIASYEFEYSEAEAQPASWTQIAESAGSSECGSPVVEGCASTVFDTSTLNGLYNLRVVATTHEGVTYESELDDRLIANGWPVVTLADPGEFLRGEVTLSASWHTESERPPVDSSSFQVRPSSGGAWRQIAEDDVSGQAHNQGKHATAALQTDAIEPGGARALPDGYYDFRVVPRGETSSETFAAVPLRRRLIDNAPPSVTLSEPERALSGREAFLSAAASDPSPGSGVAVVRFQMRPERGQGTWISVGESASPAPAGPDVFAQRINAWALANGRYEARAVAEDRAGNRAQSSIVSGIEVANGGTGQPVAASVSGLIAPAERIGLLGTVAPGTPHEETWAYGLTGAPPAEVNGAPLTYTAEGAQLVLLHDNTQAGWQVADVLREPDGRPYELLPADEVGTLIGASHQPAGGVHVAGAMTASGEGWLWLEEESIIGAQRVGLFHRKPGGSFVLDEQATERVKDLLGAGAEVSMRLAQTVDGEAYGWLLDPQQAEREDPANPGVKERLLYGQLQGGEWTLQSARPPSQALHGGHVVSLEAGDVSGLDAGGVSGWAVFQIGRTSEPGTGLMLGRLSGGAWTYPRTGLDALDLDGAFDDPAATVEPKALEVGGNALWIGASVTLPGHGTEPLVARYDMQAGTVVDSWCTLAVANACEEPLDTDHPAAVPAATFGSGSEETALALADEYGGVEPEYVDVYANEHWVRKPAPGYGQPGLQKTTEAAFAGPEAGWLVGPNALGRWSPQAQSTGSLVPWPLPDRAPLTSVALPPNSGAQTSESGAIAVGFKGTALTYASSAGWQVYPVPPRARHVNLLGVAFVGSSSAFAVGQFGTILRWDGSRWSEDPQSLVLTDAQLNAVAFGSGEGWAVGANGTILHYDGHSWTTEEVPTKDAGLNISSVAVAGGEALAVAGGNLIIRPPGGHWESAPTTTLPAVVRHAIGQAQGSGEGHQPEDLSLVAGLPDGGAVVAGQSTLLIREAPGQPFHDAAQPLQGGAVALAPFRDGAGKLRAYVSLAPPADGQIRIPAGDGELLRESASGWEDLSRAQYAGGKINGDGAVKSDPVLAVASSPDGEHAWIAGGYDGTPDAAGRGTEQTVASRAEAWQSASIWRFDAEPSATDAPPHATSNAPPGPTSPGDVSFAFFSSPMCKEECAAASGAQPDVNLATAAKQIAGLAAQAGGPAFAMLGGNAVGPLALGAFQSGNGAADFAHLDEVLAPLGSVPLFAALGPFDRVPGHGNELEPWSNAFAGAPPPFGSGRGAGAITPLSSGAPVGEVNRYYAFDTHENGGTLRVIVLDNAAGSLEASAPGQLSWLKEQLAAAQGGPPVVAVAARPLTGASGSGREVAALLANAGVLAVFTTDGTDFSSTQPGELHELDERRLIPEHAQAGTNQIPEFEGATLGYQQAANHGVTWYLASVDTQARTIKVTAVPVIQTLALEAPRGLNVARSLTLQFEAVARRPPGSLATNAGEPTPFEGYDNYVEIPSPSCAQGSSAERSCMQPAYTFASSNAVVGQFVEATGQGSPFPKLQGGHPIPSSTSGLFCAYNAGTTTVSVTTGLLSYSLPVTVQAGGIGSPCGTVPGGAQGNVIVEHSKTSQKAPGGAPPPAAPATTPANLAPAVTLVPPPPPAAAPPAPLPTPAPPAPALSPAPLPPAVEPPFSPPGESNGTPAAIVPPATPAVEPIPPGAGGYAQSPSAAERREKARKHASQSAFKLRPLAAASPVSGGAADWFYGAVVLSATIALLLAAMALSRGPKGRPALLFNRFDQNARPRRRR